MKPKPLTWDLRNPPDKDAPEAVRLRMEGQWERTFVVMVNMLNPLDYNRGNRDFDRMKTIPKPL